MEIKKTDAKSSYFLMASVKEYKNVFQNKKSKRPGRMRQPWPTKLQ